MQRVSVTEDLRKLVVDCMGRAPMFRALKPEQLEQVMKAGSLIEFEPKETIMKHGDPSDSFMVLLKGRATGLLDKAGQLIEIGEVEPPEALGVVAVVLGEPRPVSIIASESVLAIEFASKSFQKMYQTIPGFAVAVTRGMAEWIKELAHLIPLPKHQTKEPPRTEVLDMLPVGFLERHRVLPLTVDGNVLSLGFVDDPSSQVLNGAQQLLPGIKIRPLRIEAAYFNEVLSGHSGVDELRGVEDAQISDEPETARSPELDRIISRMAAEGASDLHLAAGRKPSWRIDGRIVEIADAAPLGAEDVLKLFEPVLDSRKKAEFLEYNDVDLGYAAGEIARVRVNIYRERHGVCAALRLISGKILNAEQLGLPSVVTRLCENPKGLVLVTGPTGSGKSTTLAAMVDHINRTRADHILTLEDSIEFVHHGQKALITQRELGSHTIGFSRALRAALREDPDVILVGEMRDRETIQLALEAANTGHLVFSTLHTASAMMTVDRIVDIFPADQQDQVRSTLSEVLLGVVSQTLCRRKGGGRVAAFEVLMVNPAASNLIKEGKTAQLLNVMQTGRKAGNRVLNQELEELVRKGTVDRAEALSAAVDKRDMERRLGK